MTIDRIALSVVEAARLLGRTELATRRMIERCQLPAKKHGRRVVVLRADLERLLAELPARTPGPAERPTC